jgi:hypothetical protein
LHKKAPAKLIDFRAADAQAVQFCSQQKRHFFLFRGAILLYLPKTSGDILFQTASMTYL